jgi:hypothetical protein
MAFCDFAVKYNPETDSPNDLTKRILYAIWIKRLKAHKPVVIFLGGDSGEGKSLTAITLEQILLEVQGLNLKDFMDDVNIYTPLEYPTKLDALLFNKRLHKVNVLTVHEARTIIQSKQWFSFINQAIGDVNAMSRSIKRLCFIIISQFIKDIDSTIRYTLNYYCTVKRPKGKSAQLYINVLWKDDRDLEKPKLRKRKLSGYLIFPDGKYRHYIPSYLELGKPSKDLIDIFEKHDYDSKSSIIHNKIEKLIKEMQFDLNVKSNKVDSMVDFYLSHPESLHLIGHRTIKGKWRINDDIRKAHDLTDLESKEFQSKLNTRFKPTSSNDSLSEDDLNE